MAGPQLSLPTITLPKRMTPHLRALIYASLPGTTITNLTLSEPPNQVISLTQTPPTVPLYHPPLPRKPPTNLFLTRFPLTAQYANNSIIFTTLLPHVALTPGPEVPLQDHSFVKHKLVTTNTHGLITLSSGVYQPITKASNNPIGCWGKQPVYLNAALLYLARHLHRRHNRRIGTTTTQAHNIVMIRIADNTPFLTRVSITVHGIRKWVCKIPLQGGVGRFVIHDSQFARVSDTQLVQRDRAESRGADEGPRRADEGSRHADGGRGANEGRSGANAVVDRVEEEDFMTARMRQLRFHRDEDSGHDEVIEPIEPTPETHLSPLLRVHDTDFNTTIETSSSSSSDEDDETTLELLCKRYLNQTYGECVTKELSKLNKL